ncbi:MAG: energy transducer TonB [Dysgonamonadaceae bacterium]|jgi:protein TonB|nr:energy transducer TonB [Dysgonamonadaceae bacterium]
MEIKKSSQADLENKKPTFFLLGMIVALSSLFVLLEWRTEQSDNPEWEGFPAVFIEEELIAIDDRIINQNSETEIPPEKQTVVLEDYNIVDETEMSLNEIVTIDSVKTPKDSSETGTPDFIQEEKAEDIVHAKSDVDPEFPGGITALTRFIFSHALYPASASTQKKQGRVWCSFIVNKDGSVSDIKIEKGVFISLDQEAVKVLNQMPRWNPGYINGEAVRVKVYMPVVFQL